MHVPEWSNIWEYPDFKTELETIVDWPLTADVIDSYAVQAIYDLIELVQKSVEAYNQQPTIFFENSMDAEDAAFAYFGLGRIEKILDHISATADQIKYLDGTIASIKEINAVIVPPDDSEITILPGDTQMQEKKIIPRTKTILFILANDFGVDVNDEEQLGKTKGVIAKNMMRRSSYIALEPHTLNRTILVCDEEGNATYVFDNTLLRQSGIQPDQLQGYLKSQLDDLLATDPRIGRRIVYSADFVPDIIAAVQNPARNDLITRPNYAGKYLYPRAEEGILSAAGIGEAFDVSSTIVRKIIDEIGGGMGETSLYKFGGRIAKGYSTEQQVIIRTFLEAGGYLNNPPEGYLHEFGVAQRFGVSNHTINDAVKKLSDRIGEVGRFKSRSKTTAFYSPEQQELIRQQLEEDGWFAEIAPADFMNINEFANSIGLTNSVVENAIVSVRPVLGEIRIFNFKGQHLRGLSPEQQVIIRRHFEDNGFFAEKAPDGVITYKQLAVQIGTTVKIIQRAVDHLGEELGKIKEYRFRGVTLPGLSPEQQRLILDYMHKFGHFSPELPDGYLSAKNLARSLKINSGTLAKALEELIEELGPIGIFRIKNNIRPGYSPRQQEIIRHYFEARGFLNIAPEGYVSVRKIADSLNLSSSLIQRVIGELGNTLGETGQYKFGTTITAAYSPYQQELILKYLVDRGHLSENAPEGYKSANKIATELGAKDSTVHRAIQELGEELGETKLYKFKSKIAVGYSPYQQEIIQRYITNMRASGAIKE